MTTATANHAPPVSFGAVIGQAPAAEALRRAVANDEVGHAYLLVGPDGVGQSDLVCALAAALNCPNTTEGDACGGCGVCGRIARGTHPCVITHAPVGVSYLVDSVRDVWIPAASRTLIDGTRRIIHVTAADRMNEAAQNAFLKVLEEPPPTTVWVLDAASIGPLLDTIISRCRRLDLRAWGHQDLLARARALGVDDPETARVLVRAAQGSPGRLSEFVHDLWEWHCPSCDQQTRFHGVPQVRMPTHCTNRRCPGADGGERVPLDRVAVDQPARDRHLDIVARFVRDGASAVGGVAKDLVAWADARAGAVKAYQAIEGKRLAHEGGVNEFEDLEQSVRTPVARRHKRELRLAVVASVESFLDDLGSYLRDLVAVSSGADRDDLVNLDIADQLVRDAGVVGVQTALSVLADIPAVREAVKVHSAQPQLQVEALLMPLFVEVFRRR